MAGLCRGTCSVLLLRRRRGCCVRHSLSRSLALTRPRCASCIVLDETHHETDSFSVRCSWLLVLVLVVVVVMAAESLKLAFTHV